MGGSSNSLRLALRPRHRNRSLPSQVADDNATGGRRHRSPALIQRASPVRRVVLIPSVLRLSTRITRLGSFQDFRSCLSSSLQSRLRLRPSFESNRAMHRHAWHTVYPNRVLRLRGSSASFYWDVRRHARRGLSSSALERELSRSEVGGLRASAVGVGCRGAGRDGARGSGVSDIRKQFQWAVILMASQGEEYNIRRSAFIVSSCPDGVIGESGFSIGCAVGLGVCGRGGRVWFIRSCGLSFLLSLFLLSAFMLSTLVAVVVLVSASSRAVVDVFICMPGYLAVLYE